MSDLLRLTADGLYCEDGGFHIDPWGETARAVVTHAHSDHARPGSRSYLTVPEGLALLRHRIGEGPAIETLPYGETRRVGDVSLSLRPAGHIRGSAQVRIERAGEVWVVSGDYKLEPDPTCAPFEPLRCHTFITESTFGLPIYRWPPQQEVAAQIHAWWRTNQAAGKTSVLYAYALGKAQRALAMLDPGCGPIYTHGAVESINRIYRDGGVPLPESPSAVEAGVKRGSGALVLAPPFAAGPWLRRFGPVSTAFASGWMRVRGMRRRRALDRGFVLSDHAGWEGLLAAIDATGAESVWVTHGYRAPLVRWLEEHGRRAVAIDTRFEGDRDEAPAEAEA